MNFRESYNKILKALLIEEEEKVLPEPEEGIEGIDILPSDQESGLDEETSDIDTNRIIDLTNLLLNSLRFKPSDEFTAYLKMPMFHNLSPFKKMTTIRNVLSDHPEKIIKEAEGEELDLGDGDIPKNFGNGEMTGLSENEEMDLLRLIIRAMNINPYAMSITLKELPSEADKNNYEEIIQTIEDVLF